MAERSGAAARAGHHLKTEAEESAADRGARGEAEEAAREEAKQVAAGAGRGGFVRRG